MEENVTPNPTPAAAGEDKTVAILSYITLIGLIIAFVMHGSNKTKLGAFHLRQGLGLGIMAISVWILNFVLLFIPIVGWLLMICLGIGLLVLWILGLISAINGEQKPLPVVGPIFQQIFAGIN